MRSQKSTTAIVILAVLSACAAWAHAETAATVDPAAITWVNAAGELAVGWRFFVDQEITITHLGVFDDGDDGLTSTHTVGLWRVNKTGGLTLMAQANIGPGAVTEADHHVYVDIPDLTILPDPVPYVLNGVEYYERWVVGVWSPAGSLDPFIMQPREAATITAEAAGVIRMQSFLSRGSAVFTYPWVNASDYDHFGVNFKYQLPTPVAEAGPDVAIFTSAQSVTTIAGVATDPHPGPQALTYRWLEGDVVLQDWAAVGAEDAATLSLAAPVPAFSIGTHTLTLEVTDGAFTVSDTMTLTVSNTPPQAQPAPTTQAVEFYMDAIIIAAEVSDFDGDTLTYEWVKDGVVLDSGSVDTPAGGAEVAIPDLAIAAGDSRFPLGLNEVTLVVSDGVNEAVSATASVDVQDTRAPTLCPIPSRIILLPPDGQLKPVTIWANACDRGGGPTTLSVTVESTRPPAPGQTDYYIDSINNQCDVIQMRLRAERRIPGLGRIYKVTVTATDQGGNQSSAILLILAPRLGFCL